MTHQPVGLIVARSTTMAYPELLPELVVDIQGLGLRVLLSLIDSEQDVDRAVEGFRDLELGGLIVASRPTEGYLAGAVSWLPPILLYNCRAPFIPSVSCDHGACAGRLARMLLEGGHRRFGVISGPEDSFVGRERLSGALEALAGPRVLTLEVVSGDYGYESGAGALDELFSRMKPRPSAVIAINDAMAIGALDRARALQVRVPRDLSIVGIDGTGLAQLPVYDLSTMRQPLRSMAAAAAQVLAAQMQSPDSPVEVRLFGGELIRGSTARFERPLRSPAVKASADS